METAGSSETFITTGLHGLIFQKKVIFKNRLFFQVSQMYRRIALTVLLKFPKEFVYLYIFYG
jgi:hypothetical protein